MIDLQRIWPFALAAVVLLAVVILVLLVSLLRRSARASQFEDAEPEPEPVKPEETPALPGDEKGAMKGPAPLGVRLAFGRAGRRLDRAAAGDRHRVPLLLLLGADGSRDSDLLANAGLELPFGAPADAGMDLGQGRGFWFLDRGVVLDLAGDAVLAADGRSSDERSWRSALNLLQSLRPKRPVDGVVLAIPCRELVEAQRSEAAREELAARAGRIYRKLWQMQQRLGFRLPVYLLVTGCERLPGFGKFSSLLPPRLRDEMLGWSSPFGSDAAYRSGWVDEAFSAAGKRMDDLQMEVFADTPDAADSLFVLPGAVRSLNVPVRAVLDQLFKSSAYHESLILRGIYLCGREEEAAEESGAGSTAGKTARRSFFLKDLLNDKAFREAGLALPAARTLIARNRAVRSAQAATAAAALLLGGGLVWASYSLGHQAETIEDFLGDTRPYLRQARQGEQKDLSDAKLKEGTIELLRGMARMDFNYFGSVFVPSSWFSSFHDRLQQAFTRSFEDIILRAIHNELEEEARNRIDPAMAEADPSRTVDAARIVRVELMPEFTALQRYVKEMEEVERKGRLFNKLPDSRDLQPLAELVQYAFHEELPESFFANDRMYLEALRKAQYSRFDPSRFRADASWAAEKLAESFFAALFRGNPFIARLRNLTGELQMAAVSDADASERFRDLLGRMADVETALSGTELVWGFRRQFNLGPAFEGVLTTIESSPIFDPASARLIRQAGESGWRTFQRSLAAESSPLTGRILAVDGDGRAEMQLSQGTLLLQGALKAFLTQSFVASGSSGRPILVELPPETRLVWDPFLLDKATAVTAAYVRFREKGLLVLPEDLRPAIKDVALSRSAAQAVELIASAQTFERISPAVSQILVEDEVRVDIGKFTAATRPVNELITALGGIRLDEPARDLKKAMSSEAYRLLKSVDRLLEEENAYRPRNGGFAWWNGLVPASPAAWSAKDTTEVQIYLEKTRARIANLSQVYAQPLLTWLTRDTNLPHEVKVLTDKWQFILDDLRDFDGKKPGNPVETLQDYIINKMAKVDTRSCQTAIVTNVAQAGDSLFARNLRDLSRQLESRCNSLAGDHVLELYQAAAHYFNQRLAGRYPFTSRAPGPSVPEANPEDLRAFFRLFDKCQEVFRSVPDEAGQERLRDARGFIERIARARAFFEPYLDAEKPELYPSFDVEADFRILREREVEGNQIIGWTLEVGGERITDREVENRKIRWHFGEPVRLSLRWASDGPYQPVIRTPRSGLSVRERTVVYEYTNRWSLLTALADNRATLRDLPSYVDDQPVTLALAVHTEPIAGGPRSEVPTQVFLRLTVLAPGTTKALDPPTFPERAPISEQQQQVVENEL
ncbi:MAG TPA: type VI secretion system protein [Thermoanaerobaculia bacterium]|nr:type VI secretion system protein [Thermoanaerobaculia bacterium]